MDLFNIYVVRGTETKFPFFVSLNDDNCVLHIQKYGLKGCEVGEALVVTKDFIGEIKAQLATSDNLITTMREVIENQVKDLADAGRALARLQRERDQLEAKAEDFRNNVLTLHAENAALQARIGQMMNSDGQVEADLHALRVERDAIVAELRLANANLYANLYNLRNAP